MKSVGVIFFTSSNSLTSEKTDKVKRQTLDPKSFSMKFIHIFNLAHDFNFYTGI